MRTLAFDGRMGASGDMLLAALLAAGADRATLDPVEDALDVEYRVGSTTEHGISATSVDVLLTGGDSGADDGDDDGGHGNRDDGTSDDADRAHDQSDDHAHDQSDDHAHTDHAHEHGHTPAEGHGPKRSYREVLDLVDEMDLPAGVEADATAIFELLGEAEAAVHGAALTDVHFHEVGADDAIADVVGVCLLLADLDVERVVTTPLSTGGGEVEMSHGTYPVPTPAVVELAEPAEWSLQGGPVDAELLTPTGAAILAHFADGVASLPPIRIEASGYGAGGWDFDERPNVLRATVGDTEAGLDRDAITVLETNLDDAAPEVLGGLQETLGDAGALDVSVVPLTMKKSRPGHLVKVVCKPEDAQQVARRLAEETGTLGVREHGADHRWIAQRETQTVDVSYEGKNFDVAVKVARAGEDVYDVSAEYEDGLAVARETGVPVREVMRRAEQTVRNE
jgi:uncharacterized protein (TIGR00299 family) protein